MVCRRISPPGVYWIWYLRPAANPAPAARGIGFKLIMHVGYYLMIAALVLMGLEVLYALYQLATFL
jgi:hypothetical protein